MRVRVSVVQAYLYNSMQTNEENRNDAMPPVTPLSHTHRYDSYLLDLIKKWAYTNTDRTPGRTQGEKVRTFDGIQLEKIHRKHNVRSQGDDAILSRSSRMR